MQAHNIAEHGENTKLLSNNNGYQTSNKFILHHYLEIIL